MLEVIFDVLHQKHPKNNRKTTKNTRKPQNGSVLRTLLILPTPRETGNSNKEKRGLEKILFLVVSRFPLVFVIFRFQYFFSVGFLSTKPTGLFSSGARLPCACTAARELFSSGARLPCACTGSFWLKFDRFGSFWLKFDRFGLNLIVLAQV